MMAASRPIFSRHDSKQYMQILDPQEFRALIVRLKPFLAAAVFVMPGAASANQLMDVYQLAVENDAQLRAAEFQRDAALEARPQARADVLPQLSAGYNYSEGASNGSSRQSSVNAETGLPITFVRDFDTSDTDRSLSLQLTQTVFDWAAFQRLRKASDQIAVAEANFRAAGQDLVLRVAQTYFDVLNANDNLRFATAQRAAVERQLEQAQKRFEVGLSAVTDMQEAQASYDLTIADVIQAEQELAATNEALLEIIGRQGAEPVGLREEIPLASPVPASVDDWLGGAREANVDLLIARLNAELAKADIRIARTGHLPTVDLVGRYTDSESDSISTTSLGGDQYFTSQADSIGVSVNWPIFSGGLIRSRTRQAALTYEQRNADLDASLRRVERQARDAYLGVRSGASRVRALKQAVISNQTALEASETGLEFGTRTAVDVLNAQSKLFSAQRDYAAARYAYLISVLQLKRASGRLGASDLAEIDALLVSN